MTSRRDDDEPWLAEGVRDAPATMVPRTRLLGGVLLALALAVLVALGVYFAAGHKSDGATGYVRAEDAPLIAAEPGPYKVRPADPGGAQITGLTDSLALAAGGGDQGSAIAPDDREEPLARPGIAEATPPTDLLPAAIPPAAATLPAKAIVSAPVVAPAPIVVPPAAKPAPPVAKPRAEVAIATVEQPEARPAKPPRSDSDGGTIPVKIKPVRHDDPLADDAVTKLAAAPPADDALAKAKPATKAALQLGAFSTRDKAEAAWVKAGGDGALSGLTKRIELVERDGATLYRLRAGGVGGGDAAKALCARIKSAGNACIVAE